MFIRRRELREEIKDIEDKLDKINILIEKERKEKDKSVSYNKIYSELVRRLDEKQEELNELNEELKYQPDPVDILKRELASADRNNEAVELAKESLELAKTLGYNIGKIMELDIHSTMVLNEALFSDRAIISQFEYLLRNRSMIDKKAVQKELDDEIKRQQEERLEREREREREDAILKEFIE